LDVASQATARRAKPQDEANQKSLSPRRENLFILKKRDSASNLSSYHGAQDIGATFGLMCHFIKAIYEMHELVDIFEIHI